MEGDSETGSFGLTKLESPGEYQWDAQSREESELEIQTTEPTVQPLTAEALGMDKITASVYKVKMKNNDKYMKTTHIRRKKENKKPK